MSDSTTPEDAQTGFPGVGDVLFPRGRVARPERSPVTEQAWYDYIAGYKEAADVLVGHVESTGRRADKLGYPIVFLYRQHLELAVKGVIRTCRAILGRSPDFPRHHRLNDLWQVCVELVHELQPGAASEEVEHTTRLLSEFCAVDPNADGFRYPEDRTGNASSTTQIDVSPSDIRTVVEKISLLLDCIDTSLSVERDAF